MKASVNIRKNVDVKKIRASMNVRYWEDATVNGKECEKYSDIPGGSLDMWEIIINADDGKIDFWPIGTVAYVHFKVCDGGIYELLDENGDVVFELSDYVPKCMCPGGEGCGDYVIMTISADGMIEKWKCILDEFQDAINEQF